MLKTLVVRGFQKPYPGFICYLVRNYQSNSLERVTENEVQYPRILDVSSEEAISRHERQLHYDLVKSLPTVEEKLFEITSNIPDVANIFTVEAAPARYCGIPFHYHISRSHLIRGLPPKLQELNVDNECEEIKPYFSKTIASQYSNRWSDTKIPEKGDFKTSSISKKIVFDLISLFNRRLALRNDYLLGAAFDYMPRIASYWWHGGFPHVPHRESEIFAGEKAERHELQGELLKSNFCFQYLDHPLYTVRVQKPLLPIVPLDDPLCKASFVKESNHHPVWANMPCEKRKLVNLPGFWPGDPCEYPFLSIHTTENLAKLKSTLDHYDSNKLDDAFGVMASFGWLTSHAVFQGFTTYHDVTYPVVGQTILTDGQDWNFFIYQLNTICFHSDLDKKDKRNLCWSSGKMRLFDVVENGEVKGLNDEVLKVLLKFFLNAPEIPEDILLKPYLGSRDSLKDDKANVKAELQELYSNRPDPNAWKYEIPMWQHIYKKHPFATPNPWIKLE